MRDITAKKFAETLGMGFDQMIRLFQELGFEIAGAESVVSSEEQLSLLEYIRATDGTAGTRSLIRLDDLKASTDLRELNRLLTQSMADRRIQALIKDENLDEIVDKVLSLTAEPHEELLAAAVLGRLAAVARKRQASIFGRADEIFSGEPGSIDDLDDGDAKLYAAQVLAHVSAPWLSDYAYREALLIDTADNARRELLGACLNRTGGIDTWLEVVSAHASALGAIANLEPRHRRARRIIGVMADIVLDWKGDVGAGAGKQLAECMVSLLGKRLGESNSEVIHETLDRLLAILCRIIELRFSMALQSATYALIESGKRLLGQGAWGRFIDSSSVIPRIRIALLETALVLARQNRTDRQIMAALTACYSSRPQATAAVKRHFLDAKDLDPDVAEWWLTTGNDTDSQRHVDHKVGNNEDTQIGALLIEVESNREAMDKVGRAVVPLLEISEPVLASTVKKAVDGYQSIAQIARRLARMRKLTKTDLKGERLEYNPLEHEMLGGHMSGVRRVRVVRDGIKKEFAGKIKTLVKPWVEPEQE